ncbi:hypothetical protein ACOMCU_00805 [Lysinibacillus sp. UGB7]|uniref:hypothetical protein n=1 Tax=Lysinibacillus sp. UGB7 TaxID=3411039 RepID=UPI003B76B697
MNKRTEKKQQKRTLPVRIQGKPYEEMTAAEKRQYDEFVQNHAVCETYDEHKKRLKEEQPITYRTRKPSKLLSF